MSKSELLQIDINQDLLEDLQFLIQEVEYLSNDVKTLILAGESKKEADFQKFINTIDNLKSRIDSRSYEAIFLLKTNEKELIKHYRSLIKLTRNIEKIGEFLIQSALQINYLESVDSLNHIAIERYFDIIDKQLSQIFSVYTQIDTDLTEELAEAEKELDQVYFKDFKKIQQLITEPSLSGDMLTLLFIIRYFERIGDKFLKISEGVIALSVGESLGADHYFMLKEGVQELTDDEDPEYHFKPFLFSKSGSKVGNLKISHSNGVSGNYFYKQGETRKIKPEIASLSMWNDIYPGLTPEIKWSKISENQAGLIVEKLKGADLLSLSLRPKNSKQIEVIAEALSDLLHKIWSHNFKRRKSSLRVLSQIKKREKDIIKTHENFFQEQISSKNEKNFDEIIQELYDVEALLKTPFTVLSHGDFNLDNIFFNPKTQKIQFIDTHRSSFKDYSQEIAVFIVSAMRIRIKDKQTQQQLSLLCEYLYKFGKKFAKEHNDETFDARLALGLFRSFTTSTRFLHDDEWYHKLRKKAYSCYRQIIEHKSNLAELKLDLSKILD